MIPNRVRWATMLAFVLQGVFIVTSRYRLSYDAYNHMFFGDHYRMDWWNLWEPRWYTGFEVTSYPPLVHQIIGLLGQLIGVDAAFGLLLWAVLTTYPLAMYAFSRVFTGKTVAGYAALAAAVLPSIYQAAHTFGQLPTLTGSLFALFGVASLNEYLHRGDRLSGALTVSLFTVVMAAHHATLLFLPWVIAAVLFHILLNEKPSLQSLRVLVTRLALMVLLAAAAGILVIWPFWAWGLGQSMQTPIDHPSRHNFFTDPFAPAAFFLPVYGPLILLIPFVLWKGLRKKYLGLLTAFLVLFLLGLGGTTPLPRWLFGSGWEWLTYDRFALWASLVMLPFFGVFMVVVRRAISKPKIGRSAYPPLKLFHPATLKILFVYGSFSALGLAAIVAGLLATLLPTQPPQIDMQPITRFLAQDNRSQWRYVTFGLGDQFAYLSRLTNATTIDGSYHTARSLPELRSSGIGQIDTTYWLPGAFSKLDPILQKSAQRGVRWGFVNLSDYIPILQRNGWVYLTTLDNHLEVWENPQAILPPPVTPPAETPLEQFSWGVFPLFSLFLAAALAALRFSPSAGQKLMFALHAVFVGLIPLGLCFWYYRTLVVIDHPRVYFTYDNALIFLSDALALAAFLTWAIGWFFGPRSTDQPGPGARILNQPGAWIFGLCLLSSLSCLWSQDWRTSLALSLHMWLVFGLFLSLQDRPNTWRSFALGSFAALILQVIIGFWQFGLQSTTFMKPFELNWPGELIPAIKGASVIELANGDRWLRVYGTLPHPNILGGLILAFLAGLTILFLNSQRKIVLTLILFALGVILLVLTFSRSAWLGFATFGLVLVVFSRRFDRKRLLMLFLITAISLCIIAIPLRNLIFTRSGNSTVKTETFSLDARTWLTQQGIEYFHEHPFTGVGIGSFIIELSQRAGSGYIIEPVHDIPILVASELGVGGLILLCGLAWMVFWHSIHNQRANVLLFFAILAGMFVSGLFDHYLWSLAPGRVLLGTVLGLWAGQAMNSDAKDCTFSDECNPKKLTI